MAKTAAELTAEELRSYRDSAQLQERRESAHDAARRREAIAVAREAARRLKESFCVRRVYLFGSLPSGARYHKRSDIDIAVDGLDPRDYWRADGLLEEIGGATEIHLLDLRAASPELAASVRANGLEL